MPNIPSNTPHRGDLLIAEGKATRLFEAWIEEVSNATNAGAGSLVEIQQAIIDLQQADSDLVNALALTDGAVAVNTADITANTVARTANTLAITALETLVNQVRTFLLGSRLFSGTPDLQIDSNFDVGASSVVISVDGTLYPVAAAVADTGVVATFPADTWGVLLIASNASGTLSATWDTDAGAGYTDESLAIMALPALPPGEAPLGFVTVQADAVNSFTAGTDALTGGVGGNPAQTTNYYNVADVMSVIGPAV